MENSKYLKLREQKLNDLSRRFSASLVTIALSCKSGAGVRAAIENVFFFVEDYARAQGKTYSEVFTDYMPTAVNLMAEQVIRARELGHTVIWDQTSTTIASRAKKFRMLPDYEHIAVVFRTPEHTELVRRLSSRWESGKIVPEHVVASMIAGWEEPTNEEGFKEIWFV